MAKHFFIIAIIAALAGAGYWFSPLRNKEASPDSLSVSPTPATSVSPALNPSAKPSSTAKPKTSAIPNPSVPAAIETYQDALGVYSASGFRFQFSNCQASPGSLVMKVGAKFMLDNRDVVARTIGVSSKIYNIGAYGFAIATAPVQTGTHYITCNGGGTATISVQP
ncbi:MAG: hypothetical protein Q7S09_01525 [bacterium]|nr:hypothetical protein [bacterium]